MRPPVCKLALPFQVGNGLFPIRHKMNDSPLLPFSAANRSNSASSALSSTTRTVFRRSIFELPMHLQCGSQTTILSSSCNSAALGPGRLLSSRVP